MKRLLILGGGTAGTLLANRLRRRLADDWQITVIDPRPDHVYQPGLLFVPFGGARVEDLVRPRAGTFARGVDWRCTSVESIRPERRSARMADGSLLSYDLLVLATGCEPRPDLTEGLLDHGWLRDSFEFYTLGGAQALQRSLASFEGGQLVIDASHDPLKCPTAPLALLFLADDWLRHRGLRDQVDLLLVGPRAGAGPGLAPRLTSLLERRRIWHEPDFRTAAVDGARGELVDKGGRVVRYDLLAFAPAHRGAAFLERSGLSGDEGFVRADRHSLAVPGLDGVYALGDGAALPAPKLGSAAHYQALVLEENLACAAAGRSPPERFDGRASCFVETGGGKALLFESAYGREPAAGMLPLPIGPVPLLKESRLSHWGHRAFRWIYWHGLLPGHPVPMPPPWLRPPLGAEAARA